MPADFIGTLPGWITAIASSTGVVTLIVAFWRRGVSLRGLANADEADLRDHYNTELNRVTERLTSAEDRQRACEERETELRKRVAHLEDEVTGLKRQISRYSAHQAVLLDDGQPGGKVKKPSGKVQKAARRVIKMTKGPRPQNPDHSDVLNAAEDTVHDTRQAHDTAKETCEEVKRSEGGEK